MRVASFDRFWRWIGVLSIFFSIDTVAWGTGTSGTSSFAFLNLPVGARATAMGQAFTSIPNDVQGLAYNPASLATMVASQASVQHMNYVENITQESVAIGQGGHSEGFRWGGMVNYLRIGGIDRTVATQQPTGDGFTDAGQFSTYDMMLGAVLAGEIREGVAVGTTLKFLRESLADASSNGGAIDVGALYQGKSARIWNVGASIQHMGFATKFADAGVALPLTLRVGGSIQPFAQWLVATDFVKRNDTKGEFDIGAEVTPKKYFSLRMGYRYALTRRDLGGFSDLSAGLAFRWNTLSLDYAFVPLGDLGLTHRISLNFRFKTHPN